MTLELLYSSHLKNRLRLRNIRDSLPREIIETASGHFLDSETRYYVAVKMVNLHGKMRDVMVAYALERECIKVITIHPMKRGQKNNRIESGRWIPVHEEFSNLL